MSGDDKEKVYLEDICRELGKRTMYRREDIDEVVKTVFPVMIDYMLDDKEIVIKNFGSFYLLKRAPRMCYSARNRKYTMTDYKAVIKFKPSVRFGERLAILTNPEYKWDDDNSVEDK